MLFFLPSSRPSLHRLSALLSRAIAPATPPGWLTRTQVSRFRRGENESERRVSSSFGDFHFCLTLSSPRTGKKSPRAFEISSSSSSSSSPTTTTTTTKKTRLRKPLPKKKTSTSETPSRPATRSPAAKGATPASPPSASTRSASTSSTGPSRGSRRALSSHAGAFELVRRRDRGGQEKAGGRRD